MRAREKEEAMAEGKTMGGFQEWNRPEGTFDLGEHRGSTFREV